MNVTAARAAFSCSHHDAVRKEVHGHSYVVWAYWPAEPARDQVMLQRMLDETVKARYDHRTMGPENDRVLLAWFTAAAERGWTVMAGWGVHAAHRGRQEAVRVLLDRAGAQAACLRKTKSGAPEHPLYIGYDVPLQPWP